MVVFTNTHQTTLFDNANQMALPHATVVQVINKGINNPLHLSELNKLSINQIADALLCSQGRGVDLNNPSATIHTPPFAFGAK